MKKKAAKTKKELITTIIGIVICVLLAPVLIINCLLIFKNVTNSKDIPMIGGVFPLIVLTDSMYPEIESGDLIICKSQKEFKQGDIVTYYENGSTSTVTHRIIRGQEGEDGFEWVTKGDANNIEDKPIKPDQILGVYKGRIRGLGNVIMFIQSTKGILLCVVLPIAILAIADILKKEREKKALQEKIKELEKAE